MSSAATPAAPEDDVSRILRGFLDGDHGFCEMLRQRLSKEGKKDIVHVLAKAFFSNEVLQARTLTKQQALAFRDSFVRAFTAVSLTFDKDAGATAGCVARLVVWWKDSLPQEDPVAVEKDFLSDLWDIIFNEAKYPHVLPQYRNFGQFLGGGVMKFKPKKNEAEGLLNLIMRAVECENSAGCDALFKLLGFVMQRAEFDITKLISAFQKKGKCLVKVLELFFNPLTISKVFKVGRGLSEGSELKNSPLKGKEKAVNEHPTDDIKVLWADGRSDLLVAGCSQSRSASSECSESIILKLLSSGPSPFVLCNVTESLKGLNLEILSCPQASAKFRKLLEPLITFVEMAASAVNQQDFPIPIEYIKLSRQVLVMVLTKLTTLNAETTQNTIFAEWLLERALESPTWWSQVADSTIAQEEQIDAEAQSTVCEKLKQYLGCMTKDVAENVLNCVYNRVEHFEDCSLVFQLLCGIVEAAENKVRLGLLEKQTQFFWRFIAEHHQRITALPEMQTTLQILANRTSVNVLAELFDVMQTSSSPEDSFFTFTLSMCTDKLRDSWTKHACHSTKALASSSISMPLDNLLGCISQAGHAAVHLDFIRMALSMIEGLVKNPRAADLGQDEFGKCIDEVATMWTSDLFSSASDLRKLARLIFVLLDKCTVKAHILAVADKISEGARRVLQVSYSDQIFGQILLVLSSSKSRSEPFIEVLVCSLRHCQADSLEFAARFENLKSLRKALDDPRMSAFLTDLLSVHIPAIFDAFDSPFKVIVVSLLAKLLNIAEDEITRSDGAPLFEIRSTGGDGEEDGGGGVAFFSTSALREQNLLRRTVYKSDFEEEAKRLAESSQGDGGGVGRVLGLKQLKADAETVLKNTKLILTPKTKANLETICEVIHDPAPLLLEGETGVGKSATIDAAASLTGNTLLRFNMSSRVTIDDFLGKVELAANDRFGFKKQPFTKAFEEGHWLLLDEVNLAPDQVLQRIESALDSGKLVFSNPSNAADPTCSISQHQNFRLFATQNPNAGFFRGKREELSSSFLSRFRKVHFEELSTADWKTVVLRKLESSIQHTTGKPFSEEFLTFLGDHLCNYHTAVRNAISDSAKKFPERAAYAEITIRELLKCTDHIIYLARCGEFEAESTVVASEWLSLVCQHVYVDRFRGAGATIVLQALNNAGLAKKNEMPLVLESKMSGDEQVEFRIGRVSLRVDLPSTESLKELAARDMQIEPDWISKVCEAHRAVLQLMMTTPFITNFGVYSMDSTWLTVALLRARDAQDDASAFCRSVAETYGARVRQHAAQRAVVDNVVKCFAIHDAQMCMDIVASLQPGSPLRTEKRGSDALPASEWAFVITPRVLRLWQRLILASHLPSPILGKRAGRALRSSRWLASRTCESCRRASLPRRIHHRLSDSTGLLRAAQRETMRRLSGKMASSPTACGRARGFCLTTSTTATRRCSSASTRCSKCLPNGCSPRRETPRLSVSKRVFESLLR